jgi:hypothetical protein
MRRPSFNAVLSAVVVAASAAFVFLQFHPGLLFTNTTPAGGDMGAHVWAPAFLRDHLLPNGRITGWTHDWYAGFPALHFYFPLPSLLIVLLDVVLPYGIAFKLVTVAGLVAMPIAAWTFGRLAAFPFPAPALFAVATVPFIFDRHYTIWGGNAPSTLAGEFSFSIGVSFALFFLGVLARGIRTGRGLPLAAVLFACTALSHLLPTAFAVGSALILLAVHLAPWRNGGRRFVYIAAGGLIGTAIAAFWFVPFIARLPYSNDMGWERTYAYIENLLPFLRDDAKGPMTNHLLLVFPMAAFAAVVSVVRALRGKERFGLALALMAIAAATAFRFVPDGPIWNARLLPFWYLSCYLLAGLAFAQLSWAAAWAINRFDAPTPGFHAPPVTEAVTAQSLKPVIGTQGPQRVAVAAVAFAALFLAALPLGSVPFVDPPSTNDSFIPDWARWNYEGYERKAAYPEHEQVIALMRRVGGEHGCGRTMWEYEPELDRLGTPMALMLLPYWTNGCIGSMEGLYFESSPTTPYHFLAVSEVSKAPSRPQRGLPYRDLDLDEGVRHLQEMGVRYYLAFSPEARAAAAEHPDLTLLDGAGPFQMTTQEGTQEERLWDVYRVEDAPLVEGLDELPRVATDTGREGWLEHGLEVWQDPDAAPWVAPSGPNFEGDDLAQVEASNVTLTDGKVSFDVDRTGVPVIVKVSYFPNWKASGAEGPWRITPNFMLVVPTSEHVELTYGYTAVDIAGWVLTFLGLAAVAALTKFRKRVALLLAPLAPERDSESDEAGDSPQGPLEDGGARRAGFLDDDRDLTYAEAGAFGAEDQLGVEEVAAEPAGGENGEERLTPERLHPVGVRDVEAEAVPQHEREHPGDQPP